MGPRGGQGHGIGRAGLSLAVALAALAALVAAPAVARPDLRLTVLTAHEPTRAAWRALAQELGRRTSVDVDDEVGALTGLGDPALLEGPLVVVVPSGAAAAPEELAALARFVAAGGAALVDAPPGWGPADATAIGDDDVVFKSFYLARPPRLWHGRRHGGRWAVVYTGGGLTRQLERDPFGLPPAAQPGGDQTREGAVRLAVNWVLYALCLDYKDDQVHLPFILRRRQG